MTIDERIQELGLILPETFRSPTGGTYPFSWVRVRGNRVYISGHLPLQSDGTLAEPRGKVVESISIEQGAAAARLVGLAMLGSLKREFGELERVAAWQRVLGMVNVMPPERRSFRVLSMAFRSYFWRCSGRSAVIIRARLSE